MPSTYSPLLRIQLIGQGEQANSWGNTTNVNLGTLIEQAIAGLSTITLADANHVLTQVDGEADQARSAFLLIVGNQTQPRTIIAQNTSKSYIIRNVTTGGYGVRIQRVGGGDFVEVPNGKTALVVCDGSDFASAIQYLVSPVIQGGTITNLSAPLAVNSGGTGGATADVARANLEAAKSGVNSDITALAGMLTPLAISGGGTNATNANAARINLSAAKSGANDDITSLAGLTTPLSLAQGGTGANLTATAGAVVVSAAGSLEQTTVGTTGQFLRSRGALAPQFADLSAAVTFIVDGGGAIFSTGVKGYIQVPFAATITGVTLLADTTGSVVVNILKDTYANFPPTSGDSICAAAKPTITSSNKSTDSTLTGWTRSIAANDILAFSIDSVTSITRLTISLTIVRA